MYVLVNLRLPHWVERFHVTHEILLIFVYMILSPKTCEKKKDKPNPNEAPLEHEIGGTQDRKNS
jgi:hypothetical protein